MSEITTYQTVSLVKGTISIETSHAEGNIASFTTPVSNEPLTACSADINAEQDLNGYTSPWIHDDNEQTPYLFRSSDTVAEVGNSIFDKVVGGTLAVNQLLEPLERNSANGITEVFDPESGVITLSGTATGTWVSLKNIDPIPIGHVAICVTSIIANPNNLGFKVDMFNGVFAPVSGTGSNLIRIGRILQNSRTSYTVGINGFNSGDVTDGTKLYANVIDLTQFFCGSTIADYVYNLEQSTAGSGVAWLKQYYPSIFNSYQPYNAGTLESVEASEHVMTGFNQFDVNGAEIVAGNWVGNLQNKNAHTNGYIGVMPNAEYYFREDSAVSGLYIRAYDIEKNDLGEFVAKYGNNTKGFSFTTPQDAYYIRAMWYNTDGLTTESVKNDNVCINISSSRNGEYEPYTQISYPLDSDLVLRGIPKISNGVPYYDGDEYKSDGSVTRKYGIVDLGTLTWTGSSGLKITTGLNSVIKRPSAGNVVANIITTNYTVSAAAPISANDGKIGVDTSGRLQCGTSDTPTGYLVYELATPTTETADPFTNPQVCYKGGTEEYITNNVVPVGHVTDHANICPITGHDTVNVVVSPTTTGGTTYSTALGSTVYGGTLDIVSGELTVTHATKTLDGNVTLSTVVERTNTVRAYAVKANFDPVMKPNNTLTAQAITNMGIYPPDYVYTKDVMGFSENRNASQNGIWISINKSLLSSYDSAGIKAWLSANPLQVVYPVETPTTTTLTPQEVNSLLGENNIWADTGDIEVEYVSSIKNPPHIYTGDLSGASDFIKNRANQDVDDLPHLVGISSVQNMRGKTNE